MAGVSAFAFQGTNAHALLQLPEAADADAATDNKAATAGEPVWQRQRFWVAPAPHAALQRAAVAPGKALVFECPLGASPALSFLWDHRVMGRAIVPGAAFMELAAATLSIALPDAERASAAPTLLGLAVPNPLILPETGAAAALVARTSLSLASGAVAVASSASSFRQHHLDATARQSGRVDAELVVNRSALTSAVFSNTINPAPLSPAGPIALLDGYAAPDLSAAFLVHPSTLDCCFQAAAGASAALKVPAGADALALPRQGAFGPAAELAWASSLELEATAELSRLDYRLALADAAGGVQLQGMTLKPLAGGAAPARPIAASTSTDELLYEVEWPVAEAQTWAEEELRLSSAEALFAIPSAAERAAAPLLSVLQAIAGSDRTGRGLASAAQNDRRSGARAGRRRAAAMELRDKPSLAAATLDAHAAVDSSTASTQLIRLSNTQDAPLPIFDNGAFGTAVVANARAEAHVARARLPAGSPPFSLFPQPRGALQNLKRLAFDLEAPLGAQDVLLAVRAVGINFRDVLNVLGMYPGDPGPPGADCAGVVVRVGAGVTALKPGDAVFGLAGGCLGSHVLASDMTVVPAPAGFSPEALATVPTVFVTVDAALDRLARIGPGTRVLVHAAAGGVGLAAMQVIRRAGAVALATAGGPAKRALLRSLGVRDVVGSRDTVFVDEIAMLVRVGCFGVGWGNECFALHGKVI